MPVIYCEQCKLSLQTNEQMAGRRGPPGLPPAPYMVLEFCAGGSLAKKLGGTPVEAREAAALLRTLAEAVEAAHEAKVVHRDLKPANVLLTAQGVPKVTDFGLAKVLDRDDGQTQSQAILGTPNYMAPEQARGERVDHRCDLFGLGCVLYRTATGVPPVKGPD